MNCRGGNENTNSKVVVLLVYHKEWQGNHRCKKHIYEERQEWLERDVERRDLMNIIVQSEGESLSLGIYGIPRSINIAYY